MTARRLRAVVHAAAGTATTAVGRPRRLCLRRGAQSMSTVGAHRDIGQVLLRCAEGIRSDDEATLRRAFVHDATVTHTGTAFHGSFTAGVDALVSRIHRLHDEYIRVAESPIRISIGVDGRTAVARVEFILLLGDAAFDGVGFYTLCQAPSDWKITRRVCLVHPAAVADRGLDNPRRSAADDTRLPMSREPTRAARPGIGRGTSADASAPVGKRDSGQDI